MDDNEILFEDYVLLIHKEARKAHRRVSALGGNTSKDDIFQDMCESYCLAKEKWNPGLGVMFSTYLTRAIGNNFHKTAKKVKKDVEVRALKLDKVMGDSEGASTAHEVIPSLESTAEDQAVFNSCRREVYERLSPLAAAVLKNVEQPNPVIIREFKACRHQQEFGRVNGISVYMPSVITMPFIMKVMGLSDRAKQQVNMELLKTAGIENAAS